jgi:hypothetical protein
MANIFGRKKDKIEKRLRISQRLQYFPEGSDHIKIRIRIPRIPEENM